MALTVNTSMSIGLGDYSSAPAAASATIYQGSMCTLNSSGYANALVEGEMFIGHAQAKVDNSAGANGDLNVNVYAGPYRAEVTVPSVAITDIGKDVYATDDETLSLTHGTTRVGVVERYVTTNTAVVRFEPYTVQVGAAPKEFDCETGEDTAAKVLLPGYANQNGLLVTGVYGRVTEVFAGSSEDQGVVTVRDTAENALATLTASDSAADADGDIIVGYQADAASTGDAAKTVAAGVGIEAIVTQATSGGSPAGKMRVYVRFQPLSV